jgi:hypothetical protein
MPGPGSSHLEPHAPSRYLLEPARETPVEFCRRISQSPSALCMKRGVPKATTRISQVPTSILRETRAPACGPTIQAGWLFGGRISGLPMPALDPWDVACRVMRASAGLDVMSPSGIGADRNDGGHDWGTGSASQIAALPFLYYNASAPVECLWLAAWHAIPGATSHYLLRVGLGAICRLGIGNSRDPEGSQAHTVAVGKRRDPEMRVK